MLFKIIIPILIACAAIMYFLVDFIKDRREDRQQRNKNK